MELIIVSNRKLCESGFVERLEEIASASPDKIILREKDLPLNEYKQLAVECLKICNKYGVTLVINSFAEIAAALNVKNISLSYNDFMNVISNTVFVKNFNSIGVSVHSVSEAINANLNKASYLIAGHIFETDCKKNLPPRGVNFLKEVCSCVDIPVYAIGGINVNNINAVKLVGAAGVCIMSQAMMTSEPKEFMRSIKAFC